MSSMAERLRQSNLMYRDPALYDDMGADDTTAPGIANLAATILDAKPSVSFLDLGCGTGRVARALHDSYGWDTTGVDIQPGLTAYARDRAPALSWHCADVLTFRVSRPFDVIASVGNTLSYMFTSDRLADFFRTVAVHSHPGTVLVVGTLHQPPARVGPTEPKPITTRHGPATVEIDITWNPESSLVTMSRTWRFQDGRDDAHDRFTRRVWTRDQLHAHAHSVGFRPLDHHNDHPDITITAQRRDPVS